MGSQGSPRGRVRVIGSLPRPRASTPTIGYVPYSQDLSHPIDRRRFPCYARARGLPFEVARPGRPYDVIIITAAGDPTTWARAPRGEGKLIFELVDSYLASSTPSVKDILRGPAKFLAR